MNLDGLARALFDQTLARARALVPPDAFEMAWTDGKELTEEAVVRRLTTVP